MVKVPSEVAKAFGKLRGESAGKIYLKAIGGRYYVYKESGTWDKERKKTRVKSEYLGRILDNGTYIKKIAAYADELDRAKALILEKGGSIVWPERKEGEGGAKLPEPAPIEASEIDTKLLMALSMNARTSFAHSGKLVGLSPSAAYARVKKLEKKYGIRYLAEIGMHKLGFIEFIVFAKFTEQHPSLEELKKTVSDEPKVQFAAMAKGDYDLVMYIFDEKSGTAMDTLWRLRSQSALGAYEATWWLSPISVNYGFVPFRDEFFEKVLKNKIWERSEKTPTLGPNQITQREFDVLRALNMNGARDFSEIDRDSHMSPNTSRYTYYRLKDEKEIIHRITITMEKLPIKYLSILLLRYENGREYLGTRAELLKEVITYGNFINKYAYVGDIGAPESIVLFMPAMEGDELDRTLEEIGRKIKGVKASALMITNVLVGNLCYRRFDNTHSRQQSILAETSDQLRKNRT